MTKKKPPSDDEIAKTIGDVKPLWDDLKEFMFTEYPPITEEWKFTGEKYGWSLRLVHKKRRILYLSPRKGHFRAAVILGERAIEAVRKSGLPEEILDIMNKAPKYVEGTAIYFDVQVKEQIDVLKKFIPSKMMK